MKIIRTGAVLTALLPGGCGYPQIKGDWQALQSSVLVFSGVRMAEAVKDPVYPDVCKEAVEDINAQLRRKLPEKIGPLVLAAEAPADKDYARLDMRLSQCRLDSDQAGGSFGFYLDLNLELSITDQGREVMRYQMRTGEQAQSDTPNPDWIFTFEEPFRRTLMLFDSGRVVVPRE